MKQRIVKKTQYKYGKQEKVWYAIQSYRHGGIPSMMLGLLIPFYGWLFLFYFKPYKKKWRTEHSFDKLSDAKYYLKNECEYDTEEKVILTFTTMEAHEDAKKK